MRLNLLEEPRTTFGDVRKVLSFYLLALALACVIGGAASVVTSARMTVGAGAVLDEKAPSLDDLQNELASCSDEVAFVTQLRDEVAMRQRSLRTPRRVLEAIAQALPESATLTSLRIGTDVIEMHGRVEYMRSVAEIAERLGSIAFLEAPRVQTFHASSSAGSDSGEFLIVATLKRDYSDEMPAIVVGN